jgi:hypothetical protein
MAIAYGICDDEARRNTILDDIESQMQKENLFFWPLTMFSYEEDEGRETQFPFPSYENGDLFLSWGAVAVKAYADYKPELALKYVRNVMDRHSKDGLAYQRYGREKQDGLGDDILSGNSLSVVGLYQAIYGINPLFNRFYLNPRITKELAGTELKYNYQGQKLTIGLNMNEYTVSNARYKIISNKHFGFFGKGNQLSYFNGNDATASLVIKTGPEVNLVIDVNEWNTDKMAWSIVGNRQGKKLHHTIKGLSPNSYYSITINDKSTAPARSDANGTIAFDHKTLAAANKFVITKR